MDYLFHNWNYKFNTFNNILKQVGYFNQVSSTETFKPHLFFYILKGEYNHDEHND